MPLSAYGADFYASVLLRGVSVPSAYRVALLSALPGPETTGAELAAFEPVDPSYERLEVPTGSAYWSAPVEGYSRYTSALTFTPSTNWGTIVAYALCSGMSGGQIYAYDYLTTPVYGQAGSTIQIPANALSIGMVI